MIEIRNAPADSATQPSRETFAFREPRRSRAPTRILAALAALIAFFRSSATSHDADDPQPPPTGETPARGSSETVGAPVIEEEPPKSAPGLRDANAASRLPVETAAYGRSALVFDDEPFDYARLSARAPFDLPRPPRSANDNLAPIPGGTPQGMGGGKGGGGGSKGGGGGGGNPDTPLPPRERDEDNRDDDKGPEARVNRAPRVAAPIRLPDAVSCRSTTIPLALLVAGASDPDGDALSVVNLRASSGTIERTAEGFVYTPAEHFFGAVELSFDISDGAESVAQVARFDVVRAPPILGTEGDDILVGGDCDNEIDALGGDDDVSAGDGDDLVYARAGDDIVDAGAGDDIVYAGAGDDIVYAGSGADIVHGGAGHDILFGGAGADRLYGDEGDDLIDAGADDDLVLGGDGDDVVIGGDGDDVLQGGDGRDLVLGGEGADEISGDAGADILADGAGTDTVRGGAGDDVALAAADGANDRFDGGVGRDALSFAESAASLRIDAAAGRAEGADIGVDTFLAFEEIVAGAGDDTLDAGDASVVLRGGAGDDRLTDGAGVATLDGERGDDIVMAANDAKPDLFVGGEGFDTLSFAGHSDNLFIDAADGLASRDGATFDRFSAFEKVIGGSGDDDIVAGGALKIMVGGQGDDRFVFGDRAAEAARDIPDCVYEILDLEAGDRLLVKEFELRTSGPDRGEGANDPFQQAYGGADQRPFQFRTERREDGDHTRVDVFAASQSGDPDDATVLLYSIDVHGNHHLYSIVAA